MKTENIKILKILIKSKNYIVSFFLFYFLCNILLYVKAYFCSLSVIHKIIYIFQNNFLIFSNISHHHQPCPLFFQPAEGTLAYIIRMNDFVPLSETPSGLIHRWHAIMTHDYSKPEVTQRTPLGLSFDLAKYSDCLHFSGFNFDFIFS